MPPDPPSRTTGTPRLNFGFLRSSRPRDDLDPPRPNGTGSGEGRTPRRWIETAGYVGLGVLGVLLLLVAGTLVERVSHRGSVYSGVAVPHTDVAGKPSGEARAAIQATANRLATEPIRARAGSGAHAIALTVDPAVIGYSVDVDATLKAARRDGRSRNPLDQIGGFLLRRVRDDDVPLVSTWDAHKVGNVAAAWSQQASTGVANGNIHIEGTTVTAVAPSSGRGITEAAVRAAIVRALRDGDRGTITLPIGPVRPEVDRAAVGRAVLAARAILSAPTEVVVGTATLVISPEQLAPALVANPMRKGLVISVDGTKLRTSLGPAITPYEVAAKDADWAVAADNKVTVTPEVVGQGLDLDAVGRDIAAGSHHVTGALLPIPPARTTAWAEKQHITALVGSFTTNHACCQTRVQNIHHAADLVNGTVVEAGQTFSLNDKLGPRTAESGYLKAPVFAEGEGFFDDFGGGISQFTTTLFNAEFISGYKDVSHTPHSIYITRYPEGREATINYGSIDLKFQNDTASGLLIRTSYTNTSITVSIYGDMGGRTVKLTGPNEIDKKPPGTKCTDDPTLPTGTEKVTTPGYPEIHVENFRDITQPGVPDRHERYTWHYQNVDTAAQCGTGPPLAPGTPLPKGLIPSTAPPATTAPGATTAPPAPAATTAPAN
ncbi:MAG: putative vancomycin resistance protein [Actinomycetia bacterium]|nr:putative vancomycin resistance protein [Actinomycetes bacterium]